MKEIEIQVVECTPDSEVDPCLETMETIKGSNSCTTAVLSDSLISSEKELYPGIGCKQNVQTGTSTDVRSSADFGQIPAIKLRMSNLKTEEEEEDLEDVSWFFMDDAPLGTRQTDNLANTSGTPSGASKHFDVDVDDMVLNTVAFTSLKNGGLEDTDDGDEFEECFDDVPRVMKSNTFHTNTCNMDSKSSHRTGPLKDSQTFQSTKLSIPATTVIPDSTINYNKTQKTVRQEAVRNQDPEEEGFDESFCDTEMDSRQENDLVPKATQNVGQKSRESPHLIEQLLTNMSNVRSSHSKIKNSSRHFKTIESTVQELRGENTQWKLGDSGSNHSPTTIENAQWKLGDPGSNHSSTTIENAQWKLGDSGSNHSSTTIENAQWKLGDSGSNHSSTTIESMDSEINRSPTTLDSRDSGVNHSPTTLESMDLGANHSPTTLDSRDSKVNHSPATQVDQSSDTETVPPTPDENINSPETSIEKVNNLISKLKIKSSPSKTLSRSRHFQTLDSAVVELNQEKKQESFPSNSEENDSGTQLSESIENDRVSLKDKHLGISDGVLENQSTIPYNRYQSIARGLSHDCEEVMDTVLKVAVMQTPNQQVLK
jgi:hypothetical protein